MDEHGVRDWFGAYLSDFVALGRGDTDDVRRLLLHYAVPFLISTDAATTALIDEGVAPQAAMGDVAARPKGSSWDISRVLSDGFFVQSF